ncbi:hypothetical protein L1887_62972 [Cichorium endivia]|nr:hypothetical protein L1887_62972 [Cichorium endivia]
MFHGSNTRLNAAGLAPEHSKLLPERQPKDDEADILNALHELYTSATPSDACFSVFANEAILTLPTGDVVVGPNGIRAKFAELLSSYSPSAPLRQRLLVTPESLPPPHHGARPRAQPLECGPRHQDGPLARRCSSARRRTARSRPSPKKRVTARPPRPSPRAPPPPTAFYSPTDAQLSPVTSKLNLAKRKHHMKAKPPPSLQNRSVSARPSCPARQRIAPHPTQTWTSRRPSVHSAPVVLLVSVVRSSIVCIYISARLSGPLRKGASVAVETSLSSESVFPAAVSHRPICLVLFCRCRVCECRISGCEGCEAGKRRAEREARATFCCQFPPPTLQRRRVRLSTTSPPTTTITATSIFHTNPFVTQHWPIESRCSSRARSQPCCTASTSCGSNENSINIEDRRAAVLALKGLSRDHNRAVGEHALPALLTSLQRDAKDEDTARALIECCITLCEVQSADSAASNPNHNQQTPKRKLHEQGPAPRTFAHRRLPRTARARYTVSCPSLRPDRAFYTRFASLQLLGSLLRKRPHRVQDHVLVAPGGCGAILECLAEGAGSSAEIVRNQKRFCSSRTSSMAMPISRSSSPSRAPSRSSSTSALPKAGSRAASSSRTLSKASRLSSGTTSRIRTTFARRSPSPCSHRSSSIPPARRTTSFASKQCGARSTRASSRRFCFQDWDQQKVTNANDRARHRPRSSSAAREMDDAPTRARCSSAPCRRFAYAGLAPQSGPALHFARPSPSPSWPPPTPDALERQSGELEHAAQPPTTRGVVQPVPNPSLRWFASSTLPSARPAPRARSDSERLPSPASAPTSPTTWTHALAIVNGMAPDADDKHDGAAASAAPAGKVLLEAILQNHFDTCELGEPQMRTSTSWLPCSSPTFLRSSETRQEGGSCDRRQPGR